MIWVRGKIVPDDTLRISVLDRTFEHGLGLFETFRTWNQHAPLLHRHLDRMQGSARELGLPLESAQLPDAMCVSELIAANRSVIPARQDVRLRLTLSGGQFVDGNVPRSVLWMTVGPLPPPGPASGSTITQFIRVANDDPLARHKTLNYWRKSIAHAQAVDQGSDEILCMTSDHLIREASRSNVFVIEGRRVCTPDLDGPLLPGIMRQVVVERAAALGLVVAEVPLPFDRLRMADEAFLTNSVRGILPIAHLMDRKLPAPGPVTRELDAALKKWLESEGE